MTRTGIHSDATPSTGMLSAPAGFGASLLMAALVTALLLMPIEPSAEPGVPHLDKLVHFLSFFAIVLPAVLVRPGAWPWVFALAVAWGGAIEWIQPHFGRGFDLADIVANTLGALTAFPVARWIRLRLERRQFQQRKRAKAHH